MQTRRIKAIFIKDTKDFLRNLNISLITLLPPIFAFFYNLLIEGTALPIIMVYIIVTMAYSGVGVNSLAMMISEEKEKKTLKNLVQSPASGLDILIGKSLVTALMTSLSLVLTFLIIQPTDFWSLPVIVSHLLLLVFFLVLGILFGLISPNVGTVNVYGLPQMIIFTMTPMAELVIQEDNLIRTIISYFPINQTMKIHSENSWLHVGVILIWTLVVILITAIIYRRKTVTKKG